MSVPMRNPSGAMNAASFRQEASEGMPAYHRRQGNMPSANGLMASNL